MKRNETSKDEPLAMSGEQLERQGDKETPRDNSFRLLFDNAPAAIFVEDLDGRVIDVNPAGCLLHRMSRDELIGLNVAELAPSEARDEVLRNFAQLRDGETDRLESHRYTVDGEAVPVDVRASHLRYSGQQAVLLHVTDVTEQVTLEEQLRRSQKMEAIGLLTGGIAHDFNNLLTAILGYTELCQGRVQPDDPISSDLAEVQKAGEDAAKLVAQLLAFSRQQVLEPSVLHLNEVIISITDLCRRTIGENIGLVTRLSPALKRAKLDQGQIEQLILNLAVNARDAMPAGGEILIATENLALETELSTEQVVVTPADYVSLTISDTGVGMTAEVRSQVFDPFFTTKEPDRGTGLGLSTVYGIVKQSGGYIWVESELGQGTTIRILFPATEDPIQNVALPLAEAVSAQDLTILLTEDNEVVRELSRTVLEEAGYRVLAAESAESAWQIWSQNSDAIDLLLTDWVLTGMDGLTMTRKILEQSPGTKALLMTGHSKEARFNPGDLFEGISFLRKPFTPAGLEKAVAGSLRG